MKLFIAEKPSLARAIAAGIGVGKNFNPDEYAEKYRKWRMEDLPIIPTQWKLKVKSDAAKQFKIIRALIGKANIIVNAGDPDREGQLLVNEVLDFLGNKKPVQRILLNALDEKSVRQSLNDLRDNKNFQGLKNAALGRSRADWLIGMNLSRAYTIRALNQKFLNTLKLSLEAYQNLPFAIKQFLNSDSLHIGVKIIRMKILNPSISSEKSQDILNVSHTTVAHYAQLFQQKFFPRISA